MLLSYLFREKMSIIKWRDFFKAKSSKKRLTHLGSLLSFIQLIQGVCEEFVLCRNSFTGLFQSIFAFGYCLFIFCSMNRKSSEQNLLRKLPCCGQIENGNDIKGIFCTTQILFPFKQNTFVGEQKVFSYIILII